MNIPKSLFTRSMEDLSLERAELHFFSEEEIEDAQIGYRVDSDGNPIPEWRGDNYLVFGEDTFIGDPLIVDTADKNMPVYSMFHDDWSNFVKVANSYKQFFELLDKVKSSNLADEATKDNLIAEIKGLVPEEEKGGFWFGLIQNQYEALNGIE